MTHEELLTKISDLGDNCLGIMAGAMLSDALRAVVELHKPMKSYLFDDKACSHCSSEEDRTEILYPCPTIQAIEEQLK